MTWIKPFVEMTSVNTTLASLTITPPAMVKESGWPLAASAVMHSVTLAAGTSALTTWYSRMSLKVALPSVVVKSARSMPASAKAWSVGAKTVKGPGPWRVAKSSAWITAATKLSWMPVDWAVEGMSTGGISTLSMTWMMPFEA